jgi:ATP:ADP antiporter, AAA family
MKFSRMKPERHVAYALIGAAVIGAQYIAGKAARDALFFDSFEPSALPPMIIGTSVFSITLVIASSKRLGTVSPGRYVPIAFVVSAMLLLLEWGLTVVAPRVAAPVLYLQISGIGPLLGSGFWLIASEQFDPRTAKKRFGQIGAAGTVGALVGGLVAARVTAAAGMTAVLPVLAVLNVVCAWQTRALARLRREPVPSRSPRTPALSRSGIRVLAETPYLRNLALLVFFGTVAAAFVDYVFKAQIKATFASSERGVFFSLYYAALSLITFAIQAFGSHAVLQKLGLTAAMSAPSLSLIAGGAASLLFPGVRSVVATRGSEAVCRGSLLRSGYELFYTPIAPDDKRAVKGVIDVGVDRTGDIIGAGAIQLLLWAPPPNLPATLMALASGFSIAGLIVASRLSRGYVNALERSLLDRAVELDLHDVEDRHTRTILLKTLHRSPSEAVVRRSAPPHAARLAAMTDSEVDDIATLKSSDVDRVRHVLRRDDVASAALVPHVIPLLAWDDVASDAIRALRSTAAARIGALTDALVDANQPFVVRRRLARVFGVCVAQRAADGLLLGLDDLRFEVRWQCGRSLAAIRARSPETQVDPARVLAIVRREAGVSKRVWESRQVLERTLDGPGDPFSVPGLVADRASRALEHVFTLLGLVLPAEPLRIAYHGLHTTDKSLRGTALEYLDSVLPTDIHGQLWPFLDDTAIPRPTNRPHEEVLADLLRSNQSILMNLQGQQKNSG